MSTPVDAPIPQVYTNHLALNSQRAVRLGYKNFKTRINTPDATTTDTEIAILITTSFQPFFEKLNQLENVSPDKRPTLITQYNKEFETLVAQLTELLLKNQQRYVIPIFLDDNAALEETLVIIQEAVDKGSF